ncbi:hypothetical protein J22TS1_41990 [Siminovitchia terrae]|uniref:DUF2711 family protein n=1 Tax=Siminovitchia terrae TaxID=1914933 RepID=UPI001B2C1DC0|nr:DUF2711 family protein [Siminovitchia terrae]GIN93148.1 hypothetical protein J22TS1_41990 [Siminovitchia terrae]
MLNYIWLNDKSPILKQLPTNFKSAAILLHPFIQMPQGWEENKRNNEYEHIYPSDEEILQLGKPVMWKEIMYESGLTTHEELAIALQTSIGALRKKYAREDLAEKLNSSIISNLYYPNEDFTTIFLINDLLKFLGSKGVKQLSYSDPLLDKKGILELKNTSPLDLCELSLKEIIITDENKDFAFMNVYDSFNTILLAKEKNIKNIVKSMNWEAIICDNNTYISWYSKAFLS